MSKISEKIERIERDFMIIDKADKLIPMKLCRVQRHFIENRENRNVCLKGRQMKFSTGVLADEADDLFTLPYQRQTLITHDSETSEFLFQTVQRFYRNLPQNRGKTAKDMRPQHDWKSGTRMRFPKIDNYIFVDSAKSDNVGAGHTITRAHLSEMAKWPERKGRQLWADITQTVPFDTGIICVESTPQGKGNLFHEVYNDAKEGRNGFKPFFYPWWWDEGYTTDPEIYLTDEKADTCATVCGQSLENFLRDEKLMAETFELSPGQLAFRRMKMAEIKLLFFQEYPENDSDCWMSNDMSIINGGDLRPYYANAREGKTEGNMMIWKDARGDRSYVMGVDCASGQARDYSCASVLDVRTMEYVARVRGKINTDIFAQQVFELGKRYNWAYTAVERDGHGRSVLKVLLEKEYPNLHYHADYDEFKQINSTDAGWKTSMKTKPLMINGMITAFATGDLISWSENLLYEASNLSWENGIDSKVRTSSGCNDDEFIAVSIAIQVRQSAPIADGAPGSKIPISSYV
jgi:hypothetical protein